MTFLAALILGFLVTGSPFFTFLFGMGGYFLPTILVNRAETQRLTKIDKQLSDGLVLISNSLRSGLSFAQALDTLAQQGQPPLASEFQIVTQELRLGIPMEQGLNNLSDRLKKSKEIKIAMTAINIARETGGNMAEALSTLSLTMRRRNEMQGKIDSLTAQGKFSGIVTSMLPFLLGMMIYMIDPNMMTPMFTTVPGYAMILLAIILIAVGGLLIKKIVAIDI
jgi:tight adherence protein B